MRVPRRLPFWALLEWHHQSTLFLVVRMDGHEYTGHRVSKVPEHLLGRDIEPYLIFDIFPRGVYGFTRDSIADGIEPTKRQIQYGERLIRQWKDKKLVEEI